MDSKQKSILFGLRKKMSQLELSNDEQYSIKDKVDAQVKYITRQKLPHFAPPNGVCWCCYRQIYDCISYKRASTSLITGCPHCHRSYCD